MPKQADILRAIRTSHLYLGIFIAPAVLFFAFTGVLQTFSLHEASRDGDYKPAQWILMLAQLHKKQTTDVPQRKPAPVGLDGEPVRVSKKVTNPAPAETKPRHDSVPMKIFFLAVGAGLFMSTLSGLYMSYKYTRSKLPIVALFVAGILIPLILIVV
jgi:hypothetical protein